MFEARVAQFYQSKGYVVHEAPKVRGASDNVYAVAMVAEGPLGALLISFGDAGGIDGHEIGRVRTMARDIGATPVVACPTLTPDLRRLAAQMGVVVLDESTVAESGPHPRELPGLAADPLKRDLDAHPWPASGRATTYPKDAGVTAARDVDELIADLHQAGTFDPPGRVFRAPAPAPSPPAAPLAAPAPVAAEPVPAAAAVPVQEAPARKFAWLGTAVEPPAATPAPPATVTAAPRTASGQVDLSSLLGRQEASRAQERVPVPAPAAEHEAAVVAREAFLERARMRAEDASDAVRAWPWKAILWAAVGGTAAVVLIRWMA